ncbi:GNAT family N-acetyltransferase [Labrys sp. ZIDIC5]|jgi:diamine N-acetyltransferase|uniref:GNAT family N-acetyltransferase n=1 Tax=Labrys sedimenti TaxID=3106036 RepID=UPI002AC9FD45|nr:GNAT family N-acetyltransferase [Labrys sp. ZIDIC5]MDZ5448478.1 GNAT family N-acetyltransferase [Labrys sp. ZIDIC5]
MSLTIRRAEPADTATVLDLIRGLALYEKLEHEAVATEADISASLFGPNPRVFCEIAQWQGETAGFALWFYNYSTFLGRHGIYLEDLFVKEAFRGHRIGQALLRHLAQRCVTEKLGRFEWAVLDWNEPAIGFYERQGAVLRKEWIGCRLTGEALEKLARGG